MTDTVKGLGPSRRGFLAGSAAAGLWLSMPSLAKANAETLKVGVIRPLTGSLVSSFAGNFAAAEIAIKEINESGGILGRMIEKVEVDDGGAPAQQPIAMRQLEQQGVNIVIGPIGSSQTLASLAVSSPAKILQSGYITANEGADGTKYPYHYHCSITVDLQGELFIKYLKDKGAKKVGILVEDSAAGASTLDKLLKEIPEAGIELTGHRVAPLRATDMTPYLRDLRNSGAEVLIAFVSNAIDTTQFFVGLHRLNWKPTIIGHAGLFFATASDAVPADIKYPEVYAVTYRALTYTDTEEPTQKMKDYVAKIQAMGLAPASLAPAATSPFYEFLNLLRHAAKETNSLDPEVLKAYLDQVKDYDGHFGKVSFTPENHAAYSVDAVALAEVFPASHPLFDGSLGLFRKRGE